LNPKSLPFLPLEKTEFFQSVAIFQRGALRYPAVMQTSQYSGVRKRGIYWRAGCRWKRRFINLGSWRSERTAALAVDFARFVLDTYDPAKRDGRSSKPNFMPSLEFGTQNKARQFVLQKLLDKGCISVAVARLRSEEYDKLAAAVATTNTTNGES
jgi:hypothetical protein